MKLRIVAFVICGVLACAATATADVIIAVDRETAGADGVLNTQAGFLSWNANTNPSSITFGGVTITNSGGTGFPGLRDRYNGAIPATSILFGSPLANLFRDFAQSTGTTNINMTITISGLQANTDYKVTLFGLDPQDPTNDGRGTSWYFGTNASGPLIVSFFNNNSPPVTLGPAFSQIFNTGAGTSLSFFGAGDVNAQEPKLGGNTATLVIFNGLVVESVPPVPEPASLAIWSVVGLAGAGAAWRRRKKALPAA